MLQLGVAIASGNKAERSPSMNYMYGWLIRILFNGNQIMIAKQTCADLALSPGLLEGGGGGKAWYPLHAHALLLFRF